VGAAREPGTSMLIEDVACPVDKLDGMMIDLIDMFQVRNTIVHILLYISHCSAARCTRVLCTSSTCSR
jgi:hypothetical protein